MPLSLHRAAKLYIECLHCVVQRLLPWVNVTSRSLPSRLMLCCHTHHPRPQVVEQFGGEPEWSEMNTATAFRWLLG